mmetsp:Transcript_22409/g.52851  ORF Transcript_22409/g.52851 Transcript_22409/m.52851 type:complete len:104 (-) Transcript_22409:943-1254(-)
MPHTIRRGNPLLIWQSRITWPGIPQLKQILLQGQFLISCPASNAPHKEHGLSLVGLGQFAPMWPTLPQLKQIVEMSLSCALVNSEASTPPPPPVLGRPPPGVF